MLSIRRLVWSSDFRVHKMSLVCRTLADKKFIGPTINHLCWSACPTKKWLSWKKKRLSLLFLFLQQIEKKNTKCLHLPWLWSFSLQYSIILNCYYRYRIVNLNHNDPPPNSRDIGKEKKMSVNWDMSDIYHRVWQIKW